MCGTKQFADRVFDMVNQWKFSDEEHQFADRVLELLSQWNIREQDLESVKNHAIQLMRENWTAEQVANYLQFTEEVQPDLDEETALKRMREFRKSNSLTIRGQL